MMSEGAASVSLPRGNIEDDRVLGRVFVAYMVSATIWLVFTMAVGLLVRSFMRTRTRQRAFLTDGFPSPGSCGCSQNEFPHRFGKALILIAIGHGARLRLHLVAGIAHGD